MCYEKISYSLLSHYSHPIHRTPFLLLPSLFLWFPISSLSFQFLHLLYSCYLLYSIYSLDCLYSSSLSLYPMTPLPPCTTLRDGPRKNRLFSNSRNMKIGRFWIWPDRKLDFSLPLIYPKFHDLKICRWLNTTDRLQTTEIIRWKSVKNWLQSFLKFFSRKSFT